MAVMAPVPLLTLAGARQLASERLSLVCDTKSLTPFEIFGMYFKCCQMDFSKIFDNGFWLARSNSYRG